MKSPRSRVGILACPAAVLILGTLAARADLREWVQNLEATSPVMAVFFRSMTLPAGPVLFRVPPRETRPGLTKLMAAAPTNADLVALRAREAESQLDFAAAQTDWKRYAELAADRGAGDLALADFYHRRLRPLDEIKALDAAAQAPAPKDDRLKPAREQRPWRAFERSMAEVRDQALAPQVGVDEYRAWIAKYPREEELYHWALEDLLKQKQFSAVDDLIATYSKAFPGDPTFPVLARVAVELAHGSVERAIAVADRAYQPLWPDELLKSYFGALDQSHVLRKFLDQARAALAANPNDLNAATRIFHYYHQQGNAAAERVLIEYRLGKESRKAAWNANELLTLAQLFESVADYNEAARAWYALYSLPGADAAQQEQALAGIANVLLTAPEAPIRFGAGDLSFYRDVATLDPHPGFLNGILSLLFNSMSPAEEYGKQETASVAYFHRARAAELVALFDSRFPKSAQRPELKSKLVDAYAAYGAGPSVIKAGREFLAAFPNAPQRVHVALAMADAYARASQTAQEFALYDALLKEIAARADGVPLGERAGTAQQPQIHVNVVPPTTEEQGVRLIFSRRAAPPTPARSPDYARVLDRYISRLVSLKQLPQALALYRREIDRNPNDPGLYERLAAFLDQNKMGAQVEEVYRRAMQQFPDLSWRDKLARWYLRQKQTVQFDKLTADVVRIFSGSDLERYFRGVVAPKSLDPVLYRQVNLYAHERFPHNLTFVRNLVYAYEQKGTADAAARERLLRENWFYDTELRARFFEQLAATRKLDTELAALRKMNPQAGANPAAAQFLGEAEAWRSHFESAAPALVALAAEYPGDTALGGTAASLERSLSAFNSVHVAAAVAIEENLARSEPRSHEALTRIGEIYADHEEYGRARPYWNRIPQIAPGTPGGYLEAATIFWDYYLFDDALRLMEEGRKKLANPALYAFEAGAVYENRRDYPRAVEEYAKGVFSTVKRQWGEEYSPSRSRLVRLAKRPQQRALVDQVTAKLASGPNPEAAAVSLRVEVLEAQDRRSDIEQFLIALVDRTDSLPLLVQADQIAAKQGFDAVRERSLQRQVAVTTDRVDRMRARLALVRYYEAGRQFDAARRAIDTLYSDNPTVLGVVRATVDFYARNKMPDRALDVLARAAAASYPALKKQFTLEAARKATEAASYQRARDFLAPLLASDPFNGEYLAAMADTYARAGDYRALRDFYTDKIQAMRQAPLPPEERTSSIAAMRRGLIPALTHLNDPAAVVGQYIEIIKAYPEDESLVGEAAQYAAKNKLQPRLTAYFTKAAADSPRDFRWPMVQARLAAQFEDFPGAIAAYTKASAIRPDRTDLLTARATLEERLMRFDEAAASYAKLYELTYHNPQWMAKVAETRARQGQSAAAVEAVRKAFVEARGSQPDGYFEAARRLEDWNLLSQAADFATQGVAKAGQNLFTDYANGAASYASILTRLRRADEVAAKIRKGATTEQWAPVLMQMAGAAGAYYSPEEKPGFAAFLRKQSGIPPQTLANAAKSANLADLAAELLGEAMLANPGPDAQWAEDDLIKLERARMKSAELARRLEAYWKAVPENDQQAELRNRILERAADAYRAADDAASEIRVLAMRAGRPNTNQAILKRYAGLVVKSDPQSVPVLAWQGPNWLRDAVANAAVSSGSADLALRTIVARGRGLPPVWTAAYSGLVGLYYKESGPSVNAAFLSALGNATIGERLGTHEQLVGDLWFYYGSRYGEYLSVLKRPNAEDYLPSELEQMPGNADVYARLAKQSEDNGNAAGAFADYEHALELKPNLAWVYDREAVILWQQNRRDDAVAHWKLAFEKFDWRAPQEGLSNITSALENIGSRKLLPKLHDPVDKFLRAYLHRNGAYDALLKGAMSASADPVAGLDWILDLVRAADDQVSALGMVSRADWLPEADRGRVLRRMVEVTREQAMAAYGEEKGYKVERSRGAQIDLANWLLDNTQTQAAQAVLAGILQDSESRRDGAVMQLEVRIAAATKTLDALLARYRQDPETAASMNVVQRAAAELRKRGDEVSARRIMEFAYMRELDQRNPSVPTFLGLAEIRLEAGDAPGAMALLRRMTLVLATPFENLGSAAALLEKFKRYADAAEFLDAQVRAFPWDAKARASLASVKLKAGQDREAALKMLAAVAAERGAPYDVRAEAAQTYGEAKGAALKTGSGELDLLAEGAPIAPARAAQPYFYFARVAAAKAASDPAERIAILTDALSVDPAQQQTHLLLFESAVRAKRYQVAVSAMEPFTEGTARFVQDAESYGNEPYLPEWIAGQFLQGSLEQERRVAVTRELAGAFEQLDRLPAALFFTKMALQMEESPPRRAPITADLARLRGIVTLRAQNEHRRPKITEKLEQTEWVLPRLEGRGQ